MKLRAMKMETEHMFHSAWPKEMQKSLKINPELALAVGVEVLSAVITESSSFRDITLCSLLKVI
jgi:hypothetical protein